MSVQRAESADLRGLRVGGLGGLRVWNPDTQRLWGLTGSTGEEALAVWLRSEGAEWGTRQRKSERVPSGEIKRLGVDKSEKAQIRGAEVLRMGDVRGLGRLTYTLVGVSGQSDGGVVY